jgi:hypothetical protein
MVCSQICGLGWQGMMSCGIPKVFSLACNTISMTPPTARMRKYGKSSGWIGSVTGVPSAPDTGIVLGCMFVQSPYNKTGLSSFSLSIFVLRHIFSIGGLDCFVGFAGYIWDTAWNCLVGQHMCYHLAKR